MTIEQRKKSLINWISNLNDESVISQIEVYRKSSIEELPQEIIELLKISAAEPDDDCIEHISVQDILDSEE